MKIFASRDAALKSHFSALTTPLLSQGADVTSIENHSAILQNGCDNIQQNSYLPGCLRNLFPSKQSLDERYGHAVIELKKLEVKFDDGRMIPAIKINNTMSSCQFTRINKRISMHGTNTYIGEMENLPLIFTIHGKTREGRRAEFRDPFTINDNRNRSTEYKPEQLENLRSACQFIFTDEAVFKVVESNSHGTYDSENSQLVKQQLEQLREVFPPQPGWYGY